MDNVGLIKAWMAEHVFVTIGLAAALAVVLTMLVLLIASASKRHLWLWLFRLVSLAGLTLGACAIAMGASTGATNMLEVGAGIVMVALIGYGAGVRLAREHETGRIEAVAALDSLKSEFAKHKDQAPSIKLVVEQQPLK